MNGEENMHPESQVLENSTFQKYPDVVSHVELCSMLGISKNAAYELLKSGKIRNVKIGRKYLIPKQYVIHYLLKNLK